MSEMQVKQLAQIPIKPRGRMFAAQAMHKHLGILQGGITGEMEEKVLLNDLWVFDCLIQRWVQIRPLNNLHTFPQVYGHTLEVYNSQYYKHRLDTDKKNYDLYIDKKKALKKQP